MGDSCGSQCTCWGAWHPLLHISSLHAAAELCTFSHRGCDKLSSEGLIRKVQEGRLIAEVSVHRLSSCRGWTVVTGGIWYMCTYTQMTSKTLQGVIHVHTGYAKGATAVPVDSGCLTD